MTLLEKIDRMSQGAALDGERALAELLSEAKVELEALQKEVAELKDEHQKDRVDLLSMINSLRKQNVELEKALINISTYCNSDICYNQQDIFNIKRMANQALATQPEDHQ